MKTNILAIMGSQPQHHAPPKNVEFGSLNVKNACLWKVKRGTTQKTCATYWEYIL